MVNHKKLITRNLNHVWHPCSQMKDFESCPPLIVESAKGSYLYTNKGPVIDAISSWWCKSLGHAYPDVTAAIASQLSAFEHVIGANTTHPQIVELAEELTEITNKQHVFFASDGSSAVEIALKLTLHANQLKGFPNRNQFVALKNSYHGETLATLSVSDVGLYKRPFKEFGLNCHFLQDVPYINNFNDPLWYSCDTHWQSTLKTLEPIKNQICAIIFEPVIQGAGGMLCYSAAFLRKLAEWARENDVYLIADEIMTGLGRTGEWLASHHANIEADIICLSKGLSSGSLPISCALIDHSIYQLFYDDYETGKAFLHSHTYSGNSLAVSAALATIRAMKREKINQQAARLGNQMFDEFTQLAKETGKIANIRTMGAMVAGDLINDGKQRIGFQLHQEALSRGALLRPLGNTVYWLPPLNTDKNTIRNLAEITLESIKAVFN